jgi:hypothetical protein
MRQNLFALELRAAVDRAAKQTPAERARLVVASSARRLATVVRRARPVAANRRVTARRLRAGTRRRVPRTDDDGAGGEPVPPPPPAEPPAEYPHSSSFPRRVHPASVSGRATAHGVDTVRYAFRDTAVIAALTPLPKCHPVTGERLRWRPQANGWHVRLGAGASIFVSAEHVAVEWRLAAFLTGDVADRRLIEPSQLARNHGYGPGWIRTTARRIMSPLL